jgi:hypothetical protein
LRHFPGLYLLSQEATQGRFHLVSLLVVAAGFELRSWPPTFIHIKAWMKASTDGQVICFNGGRRRPAAFAGSLVSRNFNPLAAAKWLHYCKAHHKSLCNVTYQDVLGLELIDCQYPTIVSVPAGAPYVALSYVWGKGPSNKEPNNPNSPGARSLHPAFLLASIEDVITVTKALNYRYLWVDRFCIDQKDASKKHKQVQQMDLIYRNVESTMICAAGDDGDFGLPRVGTRSRSIQPSTAIGKVQFLSTFPLPHETVRSSKYSTRGWTFQEAALSQRRLVFLEDQTYYECEAMNCWEAILSSLDILHTPDKSSFRSFMLLGAFPGFEHTHKFKPDKIHDAAEYQ